MACASRMYHSDEIRRPQRFHSALTYIWPSNGFGRGTSELRYCSRRRRGIRSHWRALQFCAGAGRKTSSSAQQMVCAQKLTLQPLIEVMLETSGKGATYYCNQVLHPLLPMCTNHRRKLGARHINAIYHRSEHTSIPTLSASLRTLEKLRADPLSPLRHNSPSPNRKLLHPPRTSDDELELFMLFEVPRSQSQMWASV